jgi:hypothetical protein
MVTLDKTGHRQPLRGVLYNSTFHVAVSVDEGGTVCVWCMQVGAGAECAPGFGGQELGVAAASVPPAAAH